MAPVSIKYVEEGAGDITLVFIHGWPDNYHVWDKQVRRRLRSVLSSPIARPRMFGGLPGWLAGEQTCNCTNAHNSARACAKILTQHHGDLFAGGIFRERRISLRRWQPTAAFSLCCSRIDPRMLSRCLVYLGAGSVIDSLRSQTISRWLLLVLPAVNTKTVADMRRLG